MLHKKHSQDTVKKKNENIADAFLLSLETLSSGFDHALGFVT
jgi:hypothetical protein